MAGVDTDIVANYGNGGVLERVLGGLRAAGKDVDALTPEDLKPMESLHVGGWEATEHLLAGLGIEPGSTVLDVGCGIGGTARTLARLYGAQVVGIDLTPEFVSVAQALSDRVGVTGVRFVVGSGAALPFEAASFDLVTMLHVGMNVADKPALFAEVARVLRPGGTFAIYDLMRVGAGALTYPMPWAGQAGISFVEAPDIYASLARDAGFEELARTDRAAFGIAFMAGFVAQGPAATGMPPDRLANVTAALTEGAIAPVELVLRRV